MKLSILRNWVFYVPSYNKKCQCERGGRMYVDRDLEQRNLPLHTSFGVHGLGLNRHKIAFLYFDSLPFSASKAKYVLVHTKESRKVDHVTILKSILKLLFLLTTMFICWQRNILGWIPWKNYSMSNMFTVWN